MLRVKTSSRTNRREQATSDKILIRDLTKQFDSRGKVSTALERVDIAVRDGEFLCIVGPSGCGKTTLLRIIAGLDQPTAGEVMLRPSGYRGQPQNAMVFQEQSLFPWMTVIENVAFGLEMRGIPRRKRYEIAEPFLDVIGLAKFRAHYPHQLSGGMKQRVSLARAFANDPEVLLMDEPFAALDAQNKLILQGELLRIWETHRKTVVFITHAIDEALALGDRVVVMTAGPGHIKDVIDVDFPRPRDVATLRSSSEFGALSLRIWRMLEDEVLKARSANE